VAPPGERFCDWATDFVAAALMPMAESPVMDPGATVRCRMLAIGAASKSPPAQSTF
jgi:hypothetical protein